MRKRKAQFIKETEIEKILREFVAKLPKPTFVKRRLPLVTSKVSSLPMCLLRVSKYIDGKFVPTCGGRILHDEDKFEDLGMLSVVQECVKCGGFVSAMVNYPALKCYRL